MSERESVSELSEMASLEPQIEEQLVKPSESANFASVPPKYCLPARALLHNATQNSGHKGAAWRETCSFRQFLAWPA